MFILKSLEVVISFVIYPNDCNSLVVQLTFGMQVLILKVNFARCWSKSTASSENLYAAMSLKW